MIDEDEMRTLGHTRRRPPTPEAAPRSAAEVLARGTRLRRRRRGLRAAGAGVGCGAIVAGLVVVATATGDPGDTGGDLSTAASPTTIDVTSPAPPSLEECATVATDDAGSTDPGATTDPAAVPDEMRLLPTWVPAGVPELSVHAHARAEVPEGCETMSPPLRPALVLGGPEGETISLLGPLARSTGLDGGGAGRVADVQGQPGRLVRTDVNDEPVLIWAGADGWWWELWSLGLGPDGEGVLASVADALVLDSSPEGDEPGATLPDAAIPAGFVVNPPADTSAMPATPGGASWMVSARHREGGVGVQCYLEVDELDGELSDSAAVGAEPAGDVGGHPALWVPVAGTPTAGQVDLLWSPASGVRAVARCFDEDLDGSQPSSRDDILQFARSVEQVAADDPRLPALSAPAAEGRQGRDHQAAGQVGSPATNAATGAAHRAARTRPMAAAREPAARTTASPAAKAVRTSGRAGSISNRSRTVGDSVIASHHTTTAAAWSPR